MYSITPIIHPHKDKNGLQKVQIRVTFKRAQVYVKTHLRVNGSMSKKMDSVLRKQLVDVENKLLDAIRDGLTTEKLKTLFRDDEKPSAFLKDYIDQLAEKKTGIAKRTMRSLGNKVGDAKTSDVSVPWLRELERSMSHLDPNTICTIMKRIKAVLYRAAEDKLVTLEQFAGYKAPLYKQKLVDYLDEKDLARFTREVKKTVVPGKKVAGYYFLLSCYTGYRLSDVRAFDPLKTVQGNSVVLRTKKNREIVSMPIHSRLKEVLDFCSTHPFYLSDQWTRKYIKDLAATAEINKHVKFHTGRHSFAMLLMANGFTIDEVAHLIGDTPLITKVYAKVHNESLRKKILKNLK